MRRSVSEWRRMRFTFGGRRMQFVLRSQYGQCKLVPEERFRHSAFDSEMLFAAYIEADADGPMHLHLCMTRAAVCQ